MSDALADVSAFGAAGCSLLGERRVAVECFSRPHSAVGLGRFSHTHMRRCERKCVAFGLVYDEGWTMDMMRWIACLRCCT